MAQGPGDHDQEPTVEAELARLLRRWWEEAGTPGGGRPTQQALAARLGVDQTTLSRYLNPRHVATAPLRVVELLHAQLRAPAAELPRARELCVTALREHSRHRTPDGGADEPPALAHPPHDPGGTADSGTGVPAAPVGFRRHWLLPALFTAAVAVSFTAGAAVNERLSARDSRIPAAGAAHATGAPSPWPLLSIDDADQFTRARALQHLLNAQGYDVRADGFFGQDTKVAVMDFQRRRLLPADGKVGQQTWPELVPDVGPGSHSSAVRAVQELLNNVGQGGTPVSGRFNATTTQDVRYFQHTHGLADTGRVDTDTWLSLLVEQLPPVRMPDLRRTTAGAGHG
ncbi:peptidoglycan-binding protein [Streptomyces sp. NPDC101490]|uniref:peptidoglycan-binding protein n=1 Tax=Streptomyces sp. NPDC101490 TaxID=3366143 RepID=UPI00380A0773